MKKYITFLALILVLSGCVRAGNFDLLPFRKSIINAARGYSIHEFNSEEYKGTSNIRENEVVMNKALTVRKGEAVLSDKLYDRASYEHTSFKPNMSGSLQNMVFPLNIDARKTYDVSYWVKIDGSKYYLLESSLDGYFYLFDEEGNFYEHGGLDKDGVLQILPEEVMVYPSGMKMEKIIKSRDEVSNVRNGYEIKYAGVQLDRIWFDYLAYDGSDVSGKFDRINFPNQPGLITVNGKGLRVIKADDNSITFMILKNED